MRPVGLGAPGNEFKRANGNGVLAGWARTAKVTGEVT